MKSCNINEDRQNQNDISGNYLHNEVTDSEYTIFRFIMTLERGMLSTAFISTSRKLFFHCPVAF